jgi:UMF1 family MFS transporter
MGLLNTLGLHRKELRAWAMYDWANSAFSTTIMASVLPIYYADVAAATLEPHLRTAYWGYTTGFGLLLVALASPILGAMADLFGRKKTYMFWFTLMGCITTAMLALVHHGDWLMASFFFLVANIGWAGANVFYDSLLPAIANNEEVDRVSTAGYAVGYLGGAILLSFNLWWILQPDTWGFEDAGAATRASFISVGIWWLIFSYPILKHVREPAATSTVRDGNPVMMGFKQLASTFRNVRQYKQIMIFLVSYWFFTDGIGTIIKMATIFGREIGIGKTDLIGALLLVQVLGMPATFLFGIVAKRLGAKASVMLCLFVYAGICVLGYVMTEGWHFWALAALVAMVQGGSQALSRSLYATMVPRHQASEFFGFISVSNRFAGIFGPMLFGLVSQFAGESRLSILFLVSFFVIGIILLSRVDVDEARRVAREAEIKAGFAS